MKLAYLMNTYPITSTTFIRREIEAIEGMGQPVLRYAIRHWNEPLADALDRAEAARTRYVLTGPTVTLLRALLSDGLANPRGLARALGLLFRLYRNAGGDLLRHVAYLVEAMALRRLTRTEGVDHVHAHFSTNATTVAMLCRRLGGPPYSFTAHGPTDFFTPYSGSLGLKVAEAAFVACISHFCRSQVMLFSHVAHWPRLHIVHCGVDPALYDRPARPGTHGCGPRLLFVGRLAAVKGLPMLLEAAAKLAAEYPGMRLTIVGDGPDRAWLEARAAELGIAAQVVFTGYRSQAEVADALTETDVFVLPSFAEGVPVVLMEAMAARVPVVATRVAGVAELVEEGVSGHLVPPGDAEALTGALRRIMGDEALRRAMGAAGRARVVEAFDARREASRLAGLFAAHHAGAPRPALRPPETAPG